MTKSELLVVLKKCVRAQKHCVDPSWTISKGYMRANSALIKFINDKEISKVYKTLTKGFTSCD